MNTSRIELRADEALDGRASDLGLAGADVHASLDELAQRCTRSGVEMVALARDIEQAAGTTAAIAAAADEGRTRIREVRAAVVRVADGVAGVIDTLGQVSIAAQEITQVALQTRLVASNASIEAQRAGAAGRGFAIVADAVKDLATKVGQSSTRIMTTVEKLDQRVAELAAQITPRAGAQGGEFSVAIAHAERGVAEIGANARSNVEVYRGAASRMRALATGADGVAESLDAARAAAQRVRELAQSMAELAGSAQHPAARRD